MAKYNGSISQVDWSSKTLPSALRRYSYSYDGVDRLLGAYYSKPGSTNLAGQAYDEQLTYDLNGNIKTLTRYGGLDSTPAQKIDQLTYSYSGNALTKVLDASGNTQGYPLGGALIPYDANGNMKSHLDKGLSLIDYNHLNLPSKIIHGANTATYSYLADGTKLKKSYGAKTTEYYGALQYEGPEGAPVLQFASTSEGYFDFVKNAYIYNYLDHLGNLRLSYRKNSAGALEVLEETNYYPFGLRHEGYGSGSTATPSYHYKYNGKELQENGMYDYGARFYMPDIGRWGVVDPLAEKMPSWSPYSYSFNNPVRYVDPDGREPFDWVRRKDGSIYWDNKANDQKTTKAGEAYMGKTLRIGMDSYIDKKLWDGPNPWFDVSGSKLQSDIWISSQENSKGELTGISATIKSEIMTNKGGFTGVKINDLPDIESYKNFVDKNDKFIGFNITLEKHAEVPMFEKIGLLLQKYGPVNVAQRIDVNYIGKDLNISFKTDVFPSASAGIIGAGGPFKLMQYDQPSYRKTHNLNKNGIRTPHLYPRK